MAASAACSVIDSTRPPLGLGGGVCLGPDDLRVGLAPTIEVAWLAAGLLVQQGVVADQDRPGPVEARQRSDRDHLRGWLAVGDAARLDYHHGRLGHAGVDRLAHGPDERVSGQVAVGQQDLDQRPGASCVAVAAPAGGPERVVGGRERALLAGLRERGGAWQRAGLADQDLQAVVQHQGLAALGDRTLVAGDHRPAGADLHHAGAQPHVDPPARKPGRNRVVVLTHADARLVVDPMGQQHPGRVERLSRQRQQVGLLCLKVLTHGAAAMTDPADVIGGVGGLKVLVELTDRGDHQDGDQVLAAEPATLALDPALLVGALDAGLAEERVEPIVAAQGDEPLVLNAIAALEDPRDRGAEVVVADPVGHPTQVHEPLDVALEERLLGLGHKRPMERPARARQAHGEQPQLRQRPLQPHPQLGEVDLSLRARLMDLRDHHLADPATQLAAQPGDVLAHRRLAKLGAVLVT
jgi:hypothetical protein